MANRGNQNRGRSAASKGSSPQPQAQLLGHYQTFVQNASDDEVNQAHHEYFTQMPQVERMGLFDSLSGALRSNGVDPRQAGVNTTDPSQASAGDLGNLFNLARNSGLLGGLFGGEQPQTSSHQGGLGGMLGGLFGGNDPQPSQSSGRQPDYNQNQSGSQGGLQGLLSNPLAQAAISGLVGYVANRAISGYANRNRNQAQSQQPQPNYNQPAQNNTQAANTDGGGSALPGFENPSSTF